MADDLIYDVGMNNGDDTAYYLHKGFRVVAVDADPRLCAAGRERFAAAIAAGRLKIVEAGIAPQEGKATFWVNETLNEWSSFERESAARAGHPVHAVEVPCVRFGSILDEHGTPHYLKIDIERYDALCLDDLRGRERPRYVSVDAHGTFAYLCMLHGLGYNAFKLVNQRDHNNPPPPQNNASVRLRVKRALSKVGPLHAAVGMARKVLRGGGGGGGPAVSGGEGGSTRLSGVVNGKWWFASGSSGPFGEETPGPWRPLPEAAYEWLHFETGNTDRGTLDMSPQAWYDFHATVK